MDFPSLAWAGAGGGVLRGLFRLFREGGLTEPRGVANKELPVMSSGSLDAQLLALVTADDGEGGGFEQLALDMFEGEASPVALQLQAREVAARPGRPAGSKNRSNLDLVKLIKATKRPTLLALKEWVDLPFEDFVAATGITKRAEAFAMWFKMAELCTAYEEGRPTQRVELKGKGVVPVVMSGGEIVDPDLVDGNPPDDEAIDAVDYTVNDKSASTNDNA